MFRNWRTGRARSIRASALMEDWGVCWKRIRSGLRRVTAFTRTCSHGYGGLRGGFAIWCRRNYCTPPCRYGVPGWSHAETVAFDGLYGLVNPGRATCSCILNIDSWDSSSESMECVHRRALRMECGERDDEQSSCQSRAHGVPNIGSLRPIVNGGVEQISAFKRTILRPSGFR